MRTMARGALVVLCAVIAVSAGLASADDRRSVPVPTTTIYPGDMIRDPMLVDRRDVVEAAEAFLESRAQIVGKVARRTLLPGRPIPVNGVTEPILVKMGGTVRIQFIEDGISISTVGTSLQPGSAGEVVRVRNMETGLVVSGTVQMDGTVAAIGSK